MNENPIPPEPASSGPAPGAPASGGAAAAATPPGAAAPPPGVGGPAAPAPTRGRRVLVKSIVVVTSVLAVLAIFAIWANRQMLNPDNWSSTSTKLLQSPVVREATANYLVDQLYANVNVEEEIKAKLPPQIKPLAGPLAGAIQNLANEAAQRALASPRVQEVWRHANKAADQQLVTVVEGGKGAVVITNGEVSLDLSAVVKNITERLGLPDVSSKLPPSVAKLKILKSNEIKLVQDGGNALKDLALALTIIVPLLYALAIALARGFRRRTLMSVGIAVVIVGLLVYIGRNILVTQVTDSLVKTEAVRPAAHEVLDDRHRHALGDRWSVHLRGHSADRGGVVRGAGEARGARTQSDRAVPARTGRLDLRDHRGDHGADLHLAADPRHRKTRRDPRAPRARLLWHLPAAKTDGRRVPRHLRGACTRRHMISTGPETRGKG